jgi:hypothetical protein
MTIGRMEVIYYQCERCEHWWIPREVTMEVPDDLPKVCPKCKSPYWNTPRRETKASKKPPK